MRRYCHTSSSLTRSELKQAVAQESQKNVALTKEMGEARKEIASLQAANNLKAKELANKSHR